MNISGMTQEEEQAQCDTVSAFLRAGVDRIHEEDEPPMPEKRNRTELDWHYGSSLGNTWNIWAGDGGPFSLDSQYVCRVDGDEETARLVSNAPKLWQVLSDLIDCVNETYDNRHEHRAAVELLLELNRPLS